MDEALAGMIIGIGTDIVSINRIDRIIGRFGTQFLDRIFTPAEQGQAEVRAQKMRFYAMRFAPRKPDGKRCHLIAAAGSAGMISK